MDYLDKFMATLPDAQRQEILKILGDKKEQGKIQTEEDLIKELEKEIAELGQIPNQPSMKYRPQSEKTNSDDYNQTWIEIRNDLRILFSESAKIDQVLTDHQRLDRAILSNISKGIKKIEDKIASYEVLFSNTEGYVQNIYETFRDKNSFNTTESLMVDRDGTPLLSADIDNTAETLVLPVLSNYNRLITEGGVSIASIKITRQIGGGFIEEANKKHDISRAIDGSDSTFWCEVILTDQPFNIPWEDPDNQGSYILTNGAACEFEIVFQNICSVSEITIKPFSEFPIEVLGIWAYENLNASTRGRRILSSKIESENIITIQFPAIECQKLKFIINQPHYTKQTYLITKDQIKNTELWKKIYNLEMMSASKIIAIDDSSWESSDDLFNTIDENEFEEYWTEFENEFKKILSNLDEPPSTIEDYINVASEAINNVIGSSDSKDKILVNKYEYVYGAYEIQVRGKSFAPSGVYVSKTIKTKGNVKQVSLVTKEDHVYAVCHESTGEISLYVPNDPTQIGLVPFQITSCEWYISPKESPTDADWLPILPLDSVDSLGLQYVACEMLRPVVQLDLKVIATTRFPFYTSGEYMPVIRRDGRVMNSSEYVLLNAKQVQIKKYFPGSYYSIQYYVNTTLGQEDYRILDFEDNSVEPTPVKEVFTGGTDRRQSIALSYYPYVDYGYINTVANSGGYDPNNTAWPPIRVTIETAEKVILPASGTNKENRTVNRTDYVTQVREALQPYSSNYPYYDYRHDGQIIVFGDKWPSGSTITIEYRYLVDNVLVKAILRRVVPFFESITPIVHEYSVKFRTINKI